jgi:hypothetical protein
MTVRNTQHGRPPARAAAAADVSAAAAAAAYIYGTAQKPPRAILSKQAS